MNYSYCCILLYSYCCIYIPIVVYNIPIVVYIFLLLYIYIYIYILIQCCIQKMWLGGKLSFQNECRGGLTFQKSRGGQELT